MIIYNNDKELVTTNIGNIHKNIGLSSVFSQADSFWGKENRFFKIISEDNVFRSIKHPTWESMSKEVIRKFREKTKNYDSFDYYDKKNNIGYRVFPYRKTPTIYVYTMLYPAITEFFSYWKNFTYTPVSKWDFMPHYDLSKLFASMENFKDLELIFEKQYGELLKKTLYEEFPQFAIFYYEIYPYINLETVNCYNISKLISARMQLQELGLDIKQLDMLVKNLDVAQNNSKVLKLIKNSK